ncbi:uncharacterized protein [Eurosta solidaginis]|uniref:uncharacterized protein n=1 Tax=Eurosta solidaginis TaxID=178769 RepID=UPI003530A4EE
MRKHIEFYIYKFLQTFNTKPISAMTRKGKRKTRLSERENALTGREHSASKSTEERESGEEEEQLSSGKPAPQASVSQTRQRVVPVATPETSLVDKVGGELLQKFEAMFFQYQLDVNRTTADAIREAMNGVRRDVRSLGERISKVEKTREGAQPIAAMPLENADTSSALGQGENAGKEEEQAATDRPGFTGRRLLTPSPQKERNYSDINKNKFKTIRDWGLKYDGGIKSIPIERFLFRVETLQRRHGISSNDLYASFHLLLTGAAQEWFWLYMEERTGEEEDGFTHLREALLDHFRKADCDEEIRQAMNERKQEHRESFDNFYACVRGMALTMKSPMAEGSLVNLMRRNLKSRIKNLIFGCQITTLAELKTQCRRAEKHLDEYERKFTKRTTIEEIDLPQGEECENGDRGPLLEAFERKERGSKRNEHFRKKADLTVTEKSGEQRCNSHFHNLKCSSVTRRVPGL